MRASIILLLTGLLAGFLPLAPGPAPRPAWGEPLSVVDGSGRPLGPVVEVSGGIATVLLERGGRLAAVHVARDRLVGGSLELVVFTSSDCTGSPFLVDYVGLLVFGASSPGPLTAIGPANDLLIATGDPPTVVPVNSLYSVGGTPPCLTGSGDPLSVLPATPLLSLDQLVGPFEIR